MLTPLSLFAGRTPNTILDGWKYLLNCCRLTASNRSLLRILPPKYVPQPRRYGYNRYDYRRYNVSRKVLSERRQ